MFDKKMKNIADAVNQVLGLEEIDPKKRTKDTLKGADEPTKQKDDVGPGSDGKSTKVKFRAGPLNTESFKEKLFNSLTEEKLDEADEEMLARYMKSRGYNPETTPKDKKIAITKSNEFKKWLNDHQFEEAGYEDYSEEQLDEMINEVLGKDASAGEWISDFVHSDDPKFKGKSKKKRQQMALAAYYAKQRNEEAELDLDEAEPFFQEELEQFMQSEEFSELDEDTQSELMSYFFDENTEPKSDKEKKLASLAHPKDKITFKDVLVGRGVLKKEEAELEEGKQPETDTVPFIEPYHKAEPDVKDKGTGGTHTPMSRAKHLARMALKKVKNEMLGKAGMTSEESGSLDEKIDHDTLNDIIKTHGFTKASKAIQKVYNDGHISKNQADKHMSYLNSHPDKVGQAKYAVEETEQIDELSNDTLKSYIKKAKTDYSKPATNPDGVRNIQPREKGIWKALGKLKKEETEQIDEISGELASRYLQKKHDRDYEKTGPYTSRRKEPQTMDQAFKDGRNTARALKRIGPLSKIGKKAK